MIIIIQINMLIGGTIALTRFGDPKPSRLCIMSSLHHISAPSLFRMFFAF